MLAEHVFPPPLIMAAAEAIYVEPALGGFLATSSCEGFCLRLLSASEARAAVIVLSIVDFEFSCKFCYRCLS